MARSDRHGNREAKQPKKLKSKEMAPVLKLTWVQRRLKPPTQKRNKRNNYDLSDLRTLFLIVSSNAWSRVGSILCV
jgi:hypothetical protein